MSCAFRRASIVWNFWDMEHVTPEIWPIASRDRLRRGRDGDRRDRPRLGRSCALI